jgi:hypothetical protein
MGLQWEKMEEKREKAFVLRWFWGKNEEKSLRVGKRGKKWCESGRGRAEVGIYFSIEAPMVNAT